MIDALGSQFATLQFAVSSQLFLLIYLHQQTCGQNGFIIIQALEPEGDANKYKKIY